MWEIWICANEDELKVSNVVAGTDETADVRESAGGSGQCSEESDYASAAREERRSTAENTEEARSTDAAPDNTDEGRSTDVGPADNTEEARSTSAVPANDTMEDTEEARSTNAAPASSESGVGHDEAQHE